MGKLGAVILAAGEGKRLRPFTDNAPKCMLTIRDETLLQRALYLLRNAGVSNVVLGLGYKKEAVQYKAYNMGVSEVFNKDWSSTNNIETLRLCLDEIEKAEYLGCDRFFIIEGDVYLGENTLQKLLQEPQSACAVLPDSYSRKGTSVELDSKGFVKVMKDNSDWYSHSQLKIANVYLINREDLEKISKEMPLYDRNCYYEAAIGKLVNSISIKGVLDGGCTEIDHSYDKFSLEENLSYAYSTVRSNWGGLWRTNLKDFFFLTNPFYPTPFIMDRLKWDFDTLVKSYPSGRRRINQMLKASAAVENDFPLFAVNGASEAIRTLENHFKASSVSFELFYHPTFGEYYRLPQGGSDRRSGTIIVTPNNPTTEKADLPAISAALEQKDVVILDLSLNADPDKMYLGLLREHKNLIVVKSLGKLMGVPGLRLGYVAAREDCIPDIEDSLPIWNINAFSERFLELHLDCLGDYEASLRKCRTASSELAKSLAELFPDDTVAHSGLFVYWITGQPIHEELYARGFYIADLAHKFDQSKRCHYRIGIRCEEDNRALVEAIRSIKKSALSASSMRPGLPAQGSTL